MLGSPLAACTGSSYSICARALASAEEIKLMLLDELTLCLCVLQPCAFVSVENTEPGLDRCPGHHAARVFLLGLLKVWYFKNIAPM